MQKELERMLLASNELIEIQQHIGKERVGRCFRKSFFGLGCGFELLGTKLQQLFGFLGMLSKMKLVIRQTFDQHFAFAIRWIAANNASETRTDASSIVGPFLKHAMAKVLCGFDKSDFVQEGQGLQWCVGSRTFDRTCFAIRSIEEEHAGRRGCAFPHGVKSPAIQTAAGVGFVVPEVPVDARFIPHPGGHVRTDTRPAELVDQQSAHRQRLVPELFGCEPEPGTACEQTVLRIALRQLRRHP